MSGTRAYLNWRLDMVQLIIEELYRLRSVLREPRIAE